jgi:hypothetical protein
LFSQPKNKKGHYIVYLGTLALEALTSHHKRRLEDKQDAGTLYRDEGLLFAAKVGPRWMLRT